MAGLLTDFLPDAFPTWHYHNKSVAKVIIKKLNEASQQRDCPGFPPDSLFIRNAGRQTGHLLRDKDSVFVWADQSFSFLFAEFQYARFGCNDVHPVSDKNQGLIAIMVTDILP